MNRLIEIRSYKLIPGAAGTFHDAVVSLAVPMLRRWQTDVVAFGHGKQEPDTYFLVRAYVDRADLAARQDAFYGSDEWRQGPREAIVSRIEHQVSVALWMAPKSIEDLRLANPSATN
ncbi:MAG: NIPSNAP family protein [Caldimonas sp.]